MTFTLRATTSNDGDFIAEMLLEACNWNSQRPAMTLSGMRESDEIWHYVDGWQRATDFGCVATSAGQLVGAAWARFFTAESHGYGYVSESIPEVGMSVIDVARGQRIGGALLDGLISLARERRAEGLSLSVEDGNTRARRLYESRGFEVAGREGKSDIMVLDLGKAQRPSPLSGDKPDR